MAELFGYPLLDDDVVITEDTSGWVKDAFVSEFHLREFPNTCESYTLFIEGDFPTSDCEGSDCCMVGNTLYWGLHKVCAGSVFNLSVEHDPITFWGFHKR